MKIPRSLQKHLNKLLATILAGLIAFFISLFQTPSEKGTGGFEACGQHFFKGIAPIGQIDAAKRPHALCFEGYAVLYSGQSRTPIYVAERLNRQIVAPEIERNDKFYAESRLPESERATLEDYKNSGYDRGHMAPAADMATPSAMAESFSLANMVPQTPNNNRKIWSKLEKDTRKYVMRATGDVYVISGPIYSKNPKTIGKNNVWIPEQLFKLVYDPNSNRSWAHVIDNTDNAEIGDPISYESLVAKVGIDFFPRK